MRTLALIITVGAILFLLPATSSAAPSVTSQLDFSSFLGNAGTESLGGMAVDASGNTYVAVTVSTKDFPGASGALSGRGLDVVVAKLDPRGRVLFATYIGGSGDDTVQSLQLDPSGNIVVGGFTRSSDFPIVSNTVVQPVASGLANGVSYGFIAKLNPAGKLIASTYLGGQMSLGAVFPLTRVNALAIDATGAIYATGVTEDTDFHTTNGVLHGSFTQGNLNDCYVAKLSADLTSWIWSTFLVPAGDTVCNAIALDAAGNVYVTGETNADGFATANAYQKHNRAASGSLNAFVAGVDSLGRNLLFFSYLGGTTDFGGASFGDNGTAIALDSAGNIWTSGTTLSSNFPVQNAFQGTYASPGANGFVTKFDATATNLLFSSYLGASQQSEIDGMAVDAAGMVYLTGLLGGPIALQPTTPAVQPAFGGNFDAFLLRLAPAGSVDYFSYLGGSQFDQGWLVAVDPAGSIYVGGSTQSPDFPLISPAPSGSSTASSGVFVSQLSNVLNSASFTEFVSPGSLASIFGSGFAQSAVQAQVKPLPTMLGQVTVKVNGQMVPLLYADQRQINFQVPFEATPGTATVLVDSGGAATRAYSFRVSQPSPGIFVYGANRAIATNFHDQGKLNGPNHPATVGDILTVYLNGPGPLDNSIADGAPIPLSPLYRATLPYSATIGNMPARVHFLGMAATFVGLAQANIQVPALAPGDYPIAITIGGVTSNAPLVTVQ